MELPPHIAPVRRFEFLLQPVRHRLEFLEEHIHGANHRLSRLLGHRLLKFQPICRRRRTDAQFHLVKPEPQVHEKALHISNHQLVVRPDLPLMHEARKFLTQFPVTALGRGERHVHPRAFV